MKALRRMLLTVATVIAVAAAVSLAVPRAIHAVAAALVRDVDNAARQPFRANCQSNNPGSTACDLVTVPSGQELVIQGVTFDVLVKPGPGSSVRCLLQGYGGTPYKAFIYTFGAQDLGPAIGFTDGTEEYTCVQNFPVYADPGMTVTAGFARGFVEPDSWQSVADLSGYTVSLP
ncbi:MAG: hypothetical protein WA211_15485 [Candidatus Acidiferrales bacterium]